MRNFVKNFFSFYFASVFNINTMCDLDNNWICSTHFGTIKTHKWVATKTKSNKELSYNYTNWGSEKLDKWKS